MTFQPIVICINSVLTADLQNRSEDFNIKGVSGDKFVPAFTTQVTTPRANRNRGQGEGRSSHFLAIRC